MHWGQVLCYAYMVARQRSLPRLEIQLTYCRRETGEIRRFVRPYAFEQLETFFQDLLFQYRMWAEMQEEWDGIRDASIRDLPFPFSSYRPGQRQLAAAVYRTVRDEGRLLCQAPTGIGKTISTLYPAVKALGEGYTEKLFYLTAKTITRQATMDACEKMAAQGAAAAHHRPDRQRQNLLFAGTPTEIATGSATRTAVPTPKGISAGSTMHYTICLAGVTSIPEPRSKPAQESTAYAPSSSSWMPPSGATVSWGITTIFSTLRCISAGFFDIPQGAYTFLIDEAHNLVDRAREMYSASLSKSTAWAVKKPQIKRGAHPRLAALNKALPGSREGIRKSGR